MKKLIILFLLVVGLSSAAQVAINTDGASPDNSAMMDVKSSDKGILIPRLTNAGRNLIPSPATGLLIYNTSTNLFNYYNGSTWCQIESTLVSSTTGMLSSGGGVSINVIPDTPPDNSAMLDINNSSRGVLFPRTTPELISSPANGLIIYNTSTNRIEYFRNNVWVSLSASLIGVPGAGGNQSSVGLAIKQNNSDPDPSAILDVEANDKGVLIPRLTEVQRNEILPVIGLTVYNLTSNAIEYYNGKGWYRLNVNFSCGQPFSDIRDTTIYNTVQIGDQCWLKENLHIGKMITGGSYMGNNSFIEKFCYNNDTTFCNEYGGLYQWNEAMQYTNIPGIQGICPTGWHIPTNIEWGVLNDALGGQSVAGGKLKETGLVHWNSPNTGATNSSGFSALGAGGWSIYNGAFAGLKDACFFWLSQYSGYSGYAYSRLLRSYVEDVYNYQYYRDEAYSVRCIKVLNSQPPLIPFSPSPADSAINQPPMNTTLSWSCSDPENEPITFDVYFGATNPPVLVSSDQTASTYNVPDLLAYNTTYYWKIMAYDNNGNSTQSPIWSFTINGNGRPCPEIPVFSYEGRNYHTVLIGNQCWFRENLNIGNMVPATSYQNNNGVIEKFCYNNDTTYCNEYGGLYQWNEAMQYTNIPGIQGICPSGWHIPTDVEWGVLNDSLGGQSVAGGKLKETGLVKWNNPNVGATNSSGFTALGAGGWSIYNGAFAGLKDNGLFWLSQYSGDSRYAYSRLLRSNTEDVYNYQYYRDEAYSVRCIKVLNSQPPLIPYSPGPADSAINQPPMNMVLSWSCSDPENEPIIFDVYFGSTNPPELVSSNQRGTTYNVPVILAYSTTYYWKIMAYDNNGNSTQGPIWSFTINGDGKPCPEIPVFSYEERNYHSVLIGNQCWLRENLNIGTMVPNTSYQNNNGIIEKYCYNNDTTYCNEYGGLYQWNEVMQYTNTSGARGICPIGWHLPDAAELNNLYDSLGGQNVAGGKMKEPGFSHWNSPNTGASNSSGFSELGSGSGDQGGFGALLNTGYFWTSQYSTDERYASYRGINYNSSSVNYGLGSRNYGFSARCLSICDNAPPSPLSKSHDATSSQIIWKWHMVPDAVGYKWNTTNDYYTAINLSSDTSMTETGLNCNTAYARYVWAYSPCDHSAPIMLSCTTSINPSPPIAALHIPEISQITWNWHHVAGATGYKWSTTNDFGTAINTGSDTTYTETGLTCLTSYTRYIWSYNSCGHSTARIATQVTLPNPPPAPIVGLNNPSLYQISWKWSSIPDIIGYKWSTSEFYNSAVDIGNDTIYTETGLGCNKTYTRYIWSYWECGHSEATTLIENTSVCPLNCLSPLTDARDGKTYSTVLIGNQCWMQQNLNYGAIAAGCTNNSYRKKRCPMDYEPFCNTKGGLYDWTTATLSSDYPSTLDICPSGWHLPDTAEWSQLIMNLGGANLAGNQMIGTSSGGTNESGFSTNWNFDFKLNFQLNNNCEWVLVGCGDSGGNHEKYWSSNTGCGLAGFGFGCGPLAINIWYPPVNFEVYTMYASDVLYWGCNVPGYSDDTHQSFSVRCLKNDFDTLDSPITGTHIPSATQIIWNWNTVPLATGYKWNTSPDYYTAMDIGANTSYTETTLSCNTSYTRYVWAYNASGYSNATTLLQSTLFDPIPSSPVVGTHIPTQSQILWNWNTVDGAMGYRWNTSNDFNSAIDMGSSTSKAESGLICNTAYTRYIWAYGACSHSSVTTLTESTFNGPPEAPISGYHSPTLTQIIWNWNIVDGATGYKWNTINDYNSATDIGTSNSKTENGLICNTTYTRFVWAYSPCGNSTSTLLTQTTILNPPTIGTCIQELNQITWNWNAVPDATGYKWNTINDFETAIDVGITTSKNETGLTCNSNYTRYVWAYCTCGNSNAISLTVSTSDDPPANPVAAVHMPSPAQIIWNWNPISNATGYKWNTTNNIGTAIYLGNITTKTETGLNCNTAYTRYIWAYGNCGNSIVTALSQTTSLNPPATPTEGNHIPSSGQVIWKWNTVPGVSGYKWNTTDNFGTAHEMGTSVSKTETGLDCNTTYTRYVWAYSNCGNSNARMMTKSTTLDPPDPPISGINIPSATQIVWNWNAVNGATGYKWSTLNNYGSAIDIGLVTTKTETGLNCNAAYTRYIWAYSSCGNSTATTMNQLTSLDPPSAPTSGTHIPSQTQIVWKWSTVPNATGYKWNTTNSYSTATNMGSSTSKTETGLTCNTNYTRYVWAYSQCGVSEVSNLTKVTSACPWSCGQPFSDSRDGKQYNTIQIYGQCWMAQNLNVGIRVDGDQNQLNNTPPIIEKYCYGDNESNCSIYGGLYQWNEMMGYTGPTNTIVQGICPDGWVVPTDADWLILTTALGDMDVAGGKMKEAGTIHWSSPNIGATNSSGFTGLPGGERNEVPGFANLNSYGYFWSSTNSTGNFHVWIRYLINSQAYAYRVGLHIQCGLSVRCIKE